MEADLIRLMEWLVDDVDLQPITRIRVDMIKRIIHLVCTSKIAVPLEKELRDLERAYDRTLHAVELQAYLKERR